MKWLSITTCLILVLLVTGCDNMFRGFSPPPTDEEAFKKPGVDIQGTKAMLIKCGNYRQDNPNLSRNLSMSDSIKVTFCMEDNGFNLPSGSTARDGCRNYTAYYKKTLPICVTRGAYK